MRDLTLQALATLLLSLRVVPMIGFAQPFTLLRIPALVRVILCVALAATLVAGNPEATWRSPNLGIGLHVVAVTELMLGIALALPMQLVFGAVMTAGRMIDIQAGFDLAALVDPTTKAQMPMVGTLLVYAAAAIFFMTDGPAQLLAIWAASVEYFPLGQVTAALDPTPVIVFAGTIAVMAIGLVGLLSVALFTLDLAIAMLSRTMPQMNVLILGFQIKGIALLMLLPLTIALSAAGFVRLLSAAIDAAAATG